MTRNEFEGSIRSAFSVLVEGELTSWDRQISLRSLTPAVEFKKVAYASNASYEDTYKAGLRFRAYNFLLTDYSFFQFWHDSESQAKRLRYAYYPNPFAFPIRSHWAETDLFDSELLEQVLDEAPLTYNRPPIRYDLAKEDYIETAHPCSHLTIGAHLSNRWPVARILTPRLFVLFIARHYYPEFWKGYEEDRLTADGFKNRLDQALADEKRTSELLSFSFCSQREKLHPFME